LELGVWQRFHAGEYMHSFVGDVTDILPSCPKLKELGLYGEFEVTRKQEFDRLKQMHIVPYDTMGDK